MTGQASKARGTLPVMTDVARMAGVSHQTVSRVLNGHRSVAPATRARVQDAIDALGYRPNLAARALVTQRTRTIGVISVDISQFGPSRTLLAIEAAARESGYFVSFAGIEVVTRNHLTAAIDHLVNAGVDGLVCLAPVKSSADALEGLAALFPSIPIVTVAASVSFADSAVAVDQRAGGQVATRHLLDLGHRTVFHLGGPPAWLEAEARAQGWASILTERGLAVPAPLIGDWSATSGYVAGKQLAPAVATGEVTAIFVANDQMALGLMRALHEEGSRVPGRVSVVGFDDVPESRFFHPPLTTLQQDFTEIGRRCVLSLMARIAGNPPPDLVALQPHLVVRSSTAPPPSPHAARTEP